MPAQRSKYSQETVDAIAKRFDTAPPAPKPPNKFGPPALVRTLAPKIRQMVDKGYSWEAMAEMMAADGVTIRPSVLRKYAARLLDRPKAKKKTKSRRTTLASRSQPAASTAPASAMQAARPTNAMDGADDAWDLEPVEEEPQGPDVLPPDARPQGPSMARTMSTEGTAGRVPSRSPAMRSDPLDL
jgi:hypothetical protein